MFKKKTMSEFHAKAFWKWFKRNEIWIITKYNTSRNAVLWAIEEKLAPVFPYLKGEIAFNLAFQPEMGEFIISASDNEKLMKDAEILKSIMPAELCDHWEFTILGPD